MNYIYHIELNQGGIDTKHEGKVLVKKLYHILSFIAGRKDPAKGSAGVFNGKKPLNREGQKKSHYPPEQEIQKFPKTTKRVIVWEKIYEQTFAFLIAISVFGSTGHKEEATETL